MKLRNINSLGQIDVPLLHRQGEPFGETGAGCLEPGEVVDVTEDQARQLLPQGDNYAPADDEAQQLLQLLGPVGVPIVHHEPGTAEGDA